MTRNATERETSRDWLLTGQTARFQAWLEAHPVAERLEDPWLLLLEGEWHRHERRAPEAAFCLEKALALFERRADAAGCFAASVDLMGVASDRQDLGALRAWAERAGALRDQGLMLDQAEYLNNLACAELAAGRQAPAEALWRQVLDFPRFGSLHIASIQQFAAINLGVAAMERTELDEAARRFRKALALADKHPLRPAVGFGARLYLARVAYYQGELAAAEAGLAQLPAAPDAYRAAEAAQLRADIALAAGRLDEAEAAIEAAISHYDELNAETADVGLAIATRGAIRVRRGQAARALPLFEQALALTAEWPQYEALVRLMQAEALGEPQPALEAAWALAERANTAFALVWAGLRLGGERAEQARGVLDRTGCWGVAAMPAVRGALDQPGVAPAHAPLAVTLLGDLVVCRDGVPITRWPRRKAPLLLAALVLKPEGYAREDLADLLFPELDFKEAEHQLDNLTSTLRKALEPTLGRKEASAFLEVRDRRYRLRPDICETDLEALAAGLARAEGLRRAGDEAWLGALAEALDRYRGNLLAEPFYLAFFEPARQHWQQRFLAASATLAEALAQRGRLEEAQDRWERMLAIEPACEEAHAGLIQLFERHGRTALAQAQRRRREAALAALGA